MYRDGNEKSNCLINQIAICGIVCTVVQEDGG